MALSDAYVTGTQYVAWTGEKVAAADTNLAQHLKDASRLAERALRLSPGALNDVSATRRFNGSGKPVLWLRDELGQHLLKAVATDGIAVDSDGDGTADYEIDPTGEAWVVGKPRNAAGASEPWDAFELLSGVGSPDFTVWPAGQGNIAFTGTWGVPTGYAGLDLMRQLVTYMVQTARAAMLAGPTDGGFAQIPPDEAVSLYSPQTWRYWRRIESLFSYRGPRVAA